MDVLINFFLFLSLSSLPLFSFRVFLGTVIYDFLDYG